MKITFLKIVLYLLSPFVSLHICTHMPSIQDNLFLLFFTMLTISEWLAISTIGKMEK